MPYAIFRYDPTEEFAMRAQVAHAADPPREAREADHADLAGRVPRRGDARRAPDRGLVRGRAHDGHRVGRRDRSRDPVQAVTGADGRAIGRLEALVLERLPQDPDPLRDIVFILRTGALFPVYRTFTLLEQLHGQVAVPTVLFYPGDLEGPAGLKFMGVLEAEHNYRAKIF